MAHFRSESAEFDDLYPWGGVVTDGLGRPLQMLTSVDVEGGEVETFAGNGDLAAVHLAAITDWPAFALFLLQRRRILEIEEGSLVTVAWKPPGPLAVTARKLREVTP